MTVDLDGLLEAQEALMSDACTVTHNPNGAADDVLDPVTLELVGTSEPVFTGPCLIARDRRLNSGVATPAEAADYTSRFLLKMPLTLLDVEPETGDQVTCTASAHDPGMVGKAFRVVEIERDGYATSRICRMVTTWASA